MSESKYSKRKETVEYPKQDEIPCVGCGTPIKKLYPEDQEALTPNWMYDGGNVEVIHCGYGSRLDTSIYIVGVCDNCLSKNGIKIGEYM